MHATAILSLLALTACGGGSGGTASIPQVNAQAIFVAPILQIGTTSQYTGTQNVVTQVNATQSAAAQAYTGSYTFTATRSVLNSSSGSSAPIDVHIATNYIVNHDPGYGSVPQSENDDLYETLSTGSNPMVTSTGKHQTEIETDESKNAQAGAPYVITANTTTQYATPQLYSGSQLQQGSPYIRPFASTEQIVFSDLNNAQASPPSGGISYTESLTNNGDGSYSYTRNLANGQVINQSDSLSGAGSYTATSVGSIVGGTKSIQAPILTNGIYSIPVTKNSTNYSATDWYPGNGLPPSPLEFSQTTVTGAVTALPASCSGALSEPNLIEADTVTSDLDIFGQSSQTTARQFIANSLGLSVCTLTTMIETVYAIETGLPSSTKTTTTVEVLTGTGVTAASTARKAV